MRQIPSTLGLLALSAITFGCSDAHKLAEAYEALCKSACECPDELERWNEVKNCKNSCEGQAKSLEAELADRDEKACDDLGRIARDIKDCARSTCEGLYACVEPFYEELYDCWPIDVDVPYYYTQDAEADEALAGEPGGIPRPLRRLALHSAAAEPEA